MTLRFYNVVRFSRVFDCLLIEKQVKMPFVSVFTECEVLRYLWHILKRDCSNLTELHVPIKPEA